MEIFADPKEDGIDSSARLGAQVKALLAETPSTIAVNIVATLTAFFIIGLNVEGAFPVVWTVSLLAVNIARLASISVMRRWNWQDRRPRSSLALICLGLLASGLIWGNVPLLGTGVLSFQVEGYLFFLIGLLCAGAMMQNSPHWLPAWLFPLPVMFFFSLTMAHGDDIISLVCCLTLIFVAAVALRICINNERRFLRSQEDRLRAVSLALSLSKANAEIMQTYDRLERQALTDPLTGLGNRALFHNRLREQLAKAGRLGTTVALLIIDLDRFKIINDSLGHGAGDDVLKAIAGRLVQMCGPDDTIVRLGGDEFAIIVIGRSSRQRALLIGEAIVRRASEPIEVEGRLVHVGASAGLAYYPEHAGSTQSLFASADMALYAAKEEGRRQLCIFNPALKERLERQRLIEAELPAALSEGSLALAFQPQVALATGEAIGFEALLRWNHPRLGWVSPPEIVEAGHAQHLSLELTTYVAERAARLLKRLPSLGLPEAIVAINVSPRDFADGALAGALVAVAERNGIDPGKLEIEITEEATLDAVASGPQLARLEGSGFRLAVDDFGAGHSSLVYLMNLKIDQLKIDRSFVKDLSVSRENQTLIAALIGIGRSLSIDVVVEGVETADEVEVLKLLGCKAAQGYYFARPMLEEQLLDWIDMSGRNHKMQRATGRNT